MLSGAVSSSRTAKAQDLAVRMGVASERRSLVLENGFTGAFETLVVNGVQVSTAQWIRANVTEDKNLTVGTGSRIATKIRANYSIDTQAWRQFGSKNRPQACRRAGRLRRYA